MIVGHRHFREVVESDRSVATLGSGEREEAMRMEAVGQPDLDERLPRHAQAARFLVNLA